MKGVESVIAIILILMIVIALAALAYTWFTGVFSSLTSTAGTAVTQTTGAMATQFRIESVRCSANPCIAASTITFILRNIGTKQFPAGRSAFYINNVRLTGVGNPACSGAATCSVAPLCQAATFYLLGEGCIDTQILTPTTAPYTCNSDIVKVTIEGGISDTAIIKCP